MKNVPIHYARTLIIARIAATIIPTPIDFNNLIIIIRGFRSRICLFHSVCLFMNFILYHKEKQKIKNYNFSKFTNGININDSTTAQNKLRKNVSSEDEDLEPNPVTQQFNSHYKFDDEEPIVDYKKSNHNS